MVESPAPRAKDRNRLAGLDVLRGLAALWVFWFHACSILIPGAGSGAKGYLAVDFFFMLSGYVMARTYEHRFAAGLRPLRFMALRYRRLWPVMAIGIAIGAPMAAIEIGDPAVYAPIAIANLALLPIFFGSILYPLNAAAWSIMAELLANFLHALGLWRLSNRALMALSAILAPALVWICIAWGNLSVGAGVRDVFAAIAIAVFGYALGIAMSRRWQDQSPLAVPGWLVVAAIPLIAITVETAAITGWWFDLAFVFVAAPLLMAGGLAIRGGHWAAKWLGAISFPLYAVNLPLLHWAHGLHFNPVVGIGLPLAVAAMIAWFTTPGLRRERAGPTACGPRPATAM